MILQIFKSLGICKYLFFIAKLERKKIPGSEKLNKKTKKYNTKKYKTRIKKILILYGAPPGLFIIASRLKNS